MVYFELFEYQIKNNLKGKERGGKMAGNLENLNGFLVGLFNEILKIEGNALCSGEAQEISLRDMHIIEAICAGKTMRERRTTAVAQRRGVTTGTLTVAINSLEKKGYVERQQDPADRRVVLLSLTEKALRAQQIHENFHREMVENIAGVLSAEEMAVLMRALGAVQNYLRPYQ